MNEQGVLNDESEHFRWALSCGCMLFVLGTVGRAQTPGATSTAPSTLVAVVDIAKVFESHPTFKTSLESLQQQAKSADLDLEGKKKSLTQRGQQLTELDPASPDYRQLEAELARQAADLQVQARQVKKDLLQREALQYYDVLQRDPDRRLIASHNATGSGSCCDSTAATWIRKIRSRSCRA